MGAGGYRRAFQNRFICGTSHAPRVSETIAVAAVAPSAVFLLSRGATVGTLTVRGRREFHPQSSYIFPAGMWHGQLVTSLKRLPNGSQQLPSLIHRFSLANLRPVGEKQFPIAGRSRGWI